jgi:hypothetical protein
MYALPHSVEQLEAQGVTPGDRGIVVVWPGEDVSDAGTADIIVRVVYADDACDT